MITVLKPQQYSGSLPYREGRIAESDPVQTRKKDSGGAGAETPTAPSPYQEAKGGILP